MRVQDFQIIRVLSSRDTVTAAVVFEHQKRFKQRGSAFNRAGSLDLYQWHVFILLRGGLFLLQTPEPFSDLLRTLYADAHRQGVDEETDHGVIIRQLIWPARYRSSETDIRLPRI